MSHTPGPWTVNQHYIETVGGLCRARIAIIDDGPGTSPDNAQLIAAAPDMLDALEKLLDSSPTLLISAPGWMDYIAAIEYARTAIAKAKGEP